MPDKPKVTGIRNWPRDDRPREKLLRKGPGALTSLDITLIKDKSLADLDNLPDPDVLANDIIENLEAAVGSFKEIMATINGKEG